MLIESAKKKTGTPTAIKILPSPEQSSTPARVSSRQAPPMEMSTIAIPISTSPTMIAGDIFPSGLSFINTTDIAKAALLVNSCCCAVFSSTTKMYVIAPTSRDMKRAMAPAIKNVAPIPGSHSSTPARLSL
jgi:hypothetical protein